MTVRVGIRAEDKSVWERRAPLAPSDVAGLAADPRLEVLVERSDRRAYPAEAYAAAGARVVDDLAAADVVLAVKEIPAAKLAAGKTYAFFAHVIKGQKNNMPLLRRLMELGATLVDYEVITDDAGRRLVFFGPQAGQAGMLETLHALGRRFAWEGVETPFLAVDQPYAYHDLAAALAAVDVVGERIRKGEADLGDTPFVVAFTGRGHVAQGAMEVFDRLPHEEVTAAELPALVARARGVRDRLFKVRLTKSDLAEPIDPGRAFDEAEYRVHPERYRGRLHRTLPHVTALVHGIFWRAPYPRFVSRQDVRELWRAGHTKLRVIGDVTCDIDGSIELTHRSTQPDRPTYVYDPVDDAYRDGVEGRGVVVLAVDNLPCELPRDATGSFSRTLAPLVAPLALADYARPFAELDLPPELLRAVIVHRGELTPSYRYLERHLAAFGDSG